jgi:CheY-like chemotaxis protein
MRYLIVDDNENIRQVIRQAVCGEGDDVFECPDGTEVLAAYQAFKPDVVLMDIQMPGRDGIRTTAEIKRRFPDARIVIVTEYNTPVFRDAAMKAGALAFVSKEDIFKLRDMLHNVQDELR